MTLRDILEKASVSNHAYRSIRRELPVSDDPCSFESPNLRGDCWRVLVDAEKGEGAVSIRVAGDYHYVSVSAARAIALALLEAAYLADREIK